MPEILIDLYYISNPMRVASRLATVDHAVYFSSIGQRGMRHSFPYDFEKSSSGKIGGKCAECSMYGAFMRPVHLRAARIPIGTNARVTDVNGERGGEFEIRGI